MVLRQQSVSEATLRKFLCGIFFFLFCKKCHDSAMCIVKIGQKKDNVSEGVPVKELHESRL